MQYVVTVKNATLAQDDLVFFVCDAVQLLQQPGVWTTDGNAANHDTVCFEGWAALPHLDHRIIHTRNCYRKEYIRKKMAEVLVPDCVPRPLISFIAVRSDGAAARLHDDSKRIARAIKVRVADLPQIEVHPEYYYCEYA